MSAEKPLPQTWPEHQRFWDAAREERLEIQRCEGCAEYVWTPRVACPYCLSFDLAWEQVSGEGAVYTFSVIHRPPTEAWAGDVPYVVGIVQLTEGPYLFTEVVNCDPAELAVGTPVTVLFDPVTEDVTLPRFEPRE